MTKNQSASECLLARFLEQETLTLTINGALSTRNKNYPIYRSSCPADDPRRGEFKDSLRDQLSCMLEEYKEGRVQDDRHFANIEDLSSTLSKHHHEILENGEFRISIAQKALNLYLKYCWARGIIEQPPHCPIDDTVLKKIKWPGPKWTEICTIEQYRHVIRKAKAKANENGQTLACWELKIWNERK